MKYIVSLFLSLCLSISLYAQDDIQTLVDAGIELHEEGKYQEAIETYKKALKIDKNSWFANYEIAFSYFALKEFEKAIKHCEISIKSDKNNAYYSYIVLGSSYDMIDKPKKAIRAYEKGIRKFPDVFLLYYNLGLTHYRLGEFKKAEDRIIKGLQLNPNHSSGHLLLAYLNYEKSGRVKTLLALYNFLVLEPDSQRAKKAYEILQEMMQYGVEVEGDKKINLTIPLGKDDDDFGAAEMMISLMQANNNTEENKGKSKQQLFFENSESLFKLLGELNESGKKKGFWWEFYVPFFNEMAENEHVEAMCYYIQIPEENETVNKWLDDNFKKVEALGEWLQQVKR